MYKFKVRLKRPIDILYKGDLNEPFPLDRDILEKLVLKGKITKAEADDVAAFYNEQILEYMIHLDAYNKGNMTIQQRVEAIARYEYQKHMKEIDNNIKRLKQERVSSKNNPVNLKTIDDEITRLSALDRETEYENVKAAVQKKASEKYPEFDFYQYLHNPNKRFYDWNDTETAHRIDEIEGHR